MRKAPIRYQPFSIFRETEIISPANGLEEIGKFGQNFRMVNNWISATLKNVSQNTKNDITTMINQLMKGLVDLIYGTGRARRKYQNENPSETVLAADGSKGIVTTDNQEIQRGLDWVTSQRAIVMLRKDFAEGIYFYQIRSNEEIIGTEKLIVQ